MRTRLREGSERSWRELDGPRWWAALAFSLTDGIHAFGILDHVRRRTAQHGLEARYPLLDLDLFELITAVPPRACSTGDLTRPLLRRAIAGRSPDAVRLRPDKSVFDDVVDAALRDPNCPPCAGSSATAPRSAPTPTRPSWQRCSTTRPGRATRPPASGPTTFCGWPRSSSGCAPRPIPSCPASEALFPRLGGRMVS